MTNRVIKTKSGFTLAEVLITLGIIGIVAAFTIPTLMQNIQDAQLKTTWKKEYSTLEQASKFYLQENSTFLNVSNYADALQPYLKIIKYCNTQSSAQGCWGSSGSYNYLKTAWGYARAGIPVNSGNPDLGLGQGLILADGTMISTLCPWSATCNLGGTACGYILVDVNGLKSPNKVGRDVYGVWVLQDKIVPIGASAVSFVYEPMLCANGDGQGGDSGYGCSALYLTQ